MNSLVYVRWIVVVMLEFEFRFFEVFSVFLATIIV